jgi:hypothetical protein
MADALTTSVSEELRSRFRGQIVQPGDAPYDTVRTVYNAMIDKHPATIARQMRCRSVQKDRGSVPEPRSRWSGISRTARASRGPANRLHAYGAIDNARPCVILRCPRKNLESSPLCRIVPELSRRSTGSCLGSYSGPRKGIDGAIRRHIDSRTGALERLE